jgi:hypothetical protein
MSRRDGTHGMVHELNLNYNKEIKFPSFEMILVAKGSQVGMTGEIKQQQTL